MKKVDYGKNMLLFKDQTKRRRGCVDTLLQGSKGPPPYVHFDLLWVNFRTIIDQ